jgi:hypothetical protein|tara:strand:+ start:6976 stop:7215 length:240 start_codon:yes stop_codon:yes gene_type:complete
VLVLGRELLYVGLVLLFLITGLVLLGLVLLFLIIGVTVFLEGVYLGALITLLGFVVLLVDCIIAAFALPFIVVVVPLLP